MPNKSIFDQGRVVGYSAYEIYLKQFLSEQTGVPASEREWLASSLTYGSSLLIKIPQNAGSASLETSVVKYEISLPSNSRLCAANTIVGSFFNGDGNFVSGSNFANKVTSYGPVLNGSDNLSLGSGGYPNTSSSNIEPDSTTLNKIRNYIKIVDGVVIQPGSLPSTSKDAANFKANLSKVPKLVLTIRGKIEQEFCILLSGFSMRTVVQGEAKVNPEYPSTSPNDGDFMGPSAYPWANKIVFSVPPMFIKYFIDANYVRRLPSTDSSVCVDESPIIDMKKCDFSAYDSKALASLTSETDRITTTSGSAAVLTVYSRDTAFPPALYGAIVSTTGECKLNPIDSIAPGTIKLFEVADITKTDAADMNIAKEYESKTPYNFSVIRDKKTGQLYQLISNIYKPVATVSFDTSINLGDDSAGNHNTRVPRVTVEAGSKSVSALSLKNSAGADYLTSTAPTTDIPADKLQWKDIISALTRNKFIDLLGAKLRSLKSALGNSKLAAGKYVLDVDKDENISVSKLITGPGVKMETTSGDTKLSAKLVSGVGISVEDSGSSVKISNTAIDDSKRVTLIPNLHYAIDYLNGFEMEYKLYKDEVAAKERDASDLEKFNEITYPGGVSDAEIRFIYGLSNDVEVSDGHKKRLVSDLCSGGVVSEIETFTTAVTSQPGLFKHRAFNVTATLVASISDKSQIASGDLHIAPSSSGRLACKSIRSVRWAHGATIDDTSKISDRSDAYSSTIFRLIFKAPPTDRSSTAYKLYQRRLKNTDLDNPIDLSKLNNADDISYKNVSESPSVWNLRRNKGSITYSVNGTDVKIPLGYAYAPTITLTRLAKDRMTDDKGDYKYTVNRPFKSTPQRVYKRVNNSISVINGSARYDNDGDFPILWTVDSSGNPKKFSTILDKYNANNTILNNNSDEVAVDTQTKESSYINYQVPYGFYAVVGTAADGFNSGFRSVPYILDTSKFESDYNIKSHTDNLNVSMGGVFY